MTKKEITVQIIVRTTKKEKEIIQQKAKSIGLSVNEFIKKTLLNDGKTDNTSDINNDITSDIINVLKEQLNVKDEQIKNLQTIIYNKDNQVFELVEDTKSKKHWWNFWK